MEGQVDQTHVDREAAQHFFESMKHYLNTRIEPKAQYISRCFYLGLPRIPADKKRPAWDYYFACFLACDATDDGTLLRAWNGIHEKVREALWDGANTFVMILRPQGLKPAQV